MAKKQDKSPEQIARERIAQAERDGATSLDLADLGLITLPPEIDRLTTPQVDAAGKKLGSHQWDTSYTYFDPQ